MIRGITWDGEQINCAASAAYMMSEWSTLETNLEKDVGKTKREMDPEEWENLVSRAIGGPMVYQSLKRWLEVHYHCATLTKEELHDLER